jgi:hypothetical protein
MAISARYNSKTIASQQRISLQQCYLKQLLPPQAFQLCHGSSPRLSFKLLRNVLAKVSTQQPPIAATRFIDGSVFPGMKFNFVLIAAGHDKSKIYNEFLLDVLDPWNTHIGATDEILGSHDTQDQDRHRVELQRICERRTIPFH